MCKEVEKIRSVVVVCATCIMFLEMFGVALSQESKVDSTHFAFRINREFRTDDERNEVTKAIGTFVKRLANANRKGPYRFYDCIGGRVVVFDADSGLIWIQISSRSIGDRCELIELSPSEFGLLSLDLEFLEKILSRYREHGGIVPTPPFLLRASKVYSYEEVCSRIKRGDAERYGPE